MEDQFAKVSSPPAKEVTRTDNFATVNTAQMFIAQPQMEEIKARITALMLEAIVLLALKNLPEVYDCTLNERARENLDEISTLGGIRNGGHVGLWILR